MIKKTLNYLNKCELLGEYTVLIIGVLMIGAHAGLFILIDHAIWPASAICQQQMSAFEVIWIICSILVTIVNTTFLCAKLMATIDDAV